MCLAIPGQVIKIDGPKITVKYPSESRIVYSGGESLKVGDHVLVQMGVVVQIISQKEAADSLSAWTSVAS